MTLIYAFTELKDMPGYVNASVQDDGSIKLQVRTSGGGNASELVMSRADYTSFIEASRLHLADPFEMPPQDRVDAGTSVIAEAPAPTVVVQDAAPAADPATLADGASPG